MRVTGTHQSTKSNENVITFWNNGKIKNFFLQNIKNFFKNVQKIYFVNANLSTISKYDLQPFGSQLMAFWFGSNNFEAIESDLFDFTPNIKFIEVYSNKIKYVGDGVFNNLKNLTHLSFSGNPCHSGFGFNRSSTINLISVIEVKCKDLQALERQRKLNPTTTEAPKTTENILIEDLKSEILKLKIEHKQKVGDLEAKHDTENEIKNVAIEKLKQEIEELSNDHKKKIDELSAINAGQQAALKLKIEKLVEENKKISVTVKDQEFKELNNNLMQKFEELKLQINAKLESTGAKIDFKLKTADVKLNTIVFKLDTAKSQLESSKDTCSEQFTSINATCTALDFKIENLNKNCEHFYRQP